MGGDGGAIFANAVAAVEDRKKLQQAAWEVRPAKAPPNTLIECFANLPEEVVRLGELLERLIHERDQ